MSLTNEQRAAIVTEALTWSNTPYHHQASIKGAGVDCIMLIVEVYKACGLLPSELDPRPYTMDWHLHRNDEVYLGGVEQFSEQTDTPRPGDVVLFQFGRCVSHGALVIEWPLVIHAYQENRFVVQTDVSKSDALMSRLRGFYTLKG
ncbi:NlpC/P60 family protein [Undibacterium sp. Di27W]|uniref:NlpC/P60 family protein n=1 Tax=Undibacterium sp. Di27W TaxID=3413036 RepID=UPI003BF25B1C